MMKRDIPCDICGSFEKRPLFDRARNNEEVSNVICQQCGLVYISPREDAASIQDRYSTGKFSLEARGDTYPSTEKIAHSERVAWERYELLSTVKDLSNISPNGKLLEIGCGIGSFLRLMRGAGYSVLGLEPDMACTKTGERLYNIPIRAGFYEQTELGQGSFDMIAVFHVLEHTQSPRVFLEKTYNELRLGGELHLEVPCIENPHGGDLENFFWSENLYTFSKNTLVGLLSQAGFRVTHTGYVGNFLWILAKKSELASDQIPGYPFDDPETVWQRTHHLYRLFLSGGVKSMDAPGASAPPLFQRVAKKILHRPEDVFPALERKVSNFSKNKLPLLAGGLSGVLLNRPRLAHVGLHSPGNAGDTMLFTAVRGLMDKVNGPYRWSLESLWAEMTDETIQRLNKSVKGIIIGGGGILLRDTKPNQSSGWQWNCSIENLRKIKVPIAIFAIGYNRFREQEDFNRFFRPHISELVQKSIFFSLRNQGSIRNLAQYLDPDLAAKLIYQPCPTTLLRYLYPAYLRDTRNDHPKKLVLNTAFDRHELRFDRRENEILTALARAMKRAKRNGWEIQLAIHVPDDATIIPWLIREKVEFSTIRLDGKPYEDILNFYSATSLTIGMRGHSQMIPFGLGKPIISIITHDKLKYFLEDIGHQEWGVDVKDSLLEDKLVEKIEACVLDYELIKTQIADAQDKLWDITAQNLRDIKGKMGA